MSGSIRSAVVVVLAWMAIGACVSELMARRNVVLAIVEDGTWSWVSGVMSHVSEGFDDSDN